MRCHGDRESYFIVNEDAVEIHSYSEILQRLGSGSGPAAAPTVTSGASTVGNAAVGTAAVSAAAVAQPNVSGNEEPKYKFGWISGRTKKQNPSADELIPKVVALGVCMNDPLHCPNHPPSATSPAESGDSTIASGYTYLGQFLAHEITFDKEHLPNPESHRSPQIDLDSLYGRGPQNDSQLFQNDGVRLQVSSTTVVDKNLNRTFENDLLRADDGRAKIGDPRNDENLVIAQMHVAFITFHNKVVDDLASSSSGVSAGQLFARAHDEVIKYFQWIIVHDYLPKIVGQDMVDRVLQEGLKGFRFAADEKDKLFIPLEFSAAAFRIGHSMVRDSYRWNQYRPSVMLLELFSHTRHSGKLAKLPSDWVIDWRRFFDFQELGYKAVSINMAKALDTSFGLHIEGIPDFPHKVSDPHLQAITIRNLIRGYELGVPCGEEMATYLDVKRKLLPEELRATEQKHLLEDPFFADRTPLWYYVLREAEIASQEHGSSRLGEVGGLIVAGTLLEIIRHSPSSILQDTEWEPKFGRPALDGGPRRFDMTDLLHTAGVVAPIAAHHGYPDEP